MPPKRSAAAATARSNNTNKRAKHADNNNNNNNNNDEQDAGLPWEQDNDVATVSIPAIDSVVDAMLDPLDSLIQAKGSTTQTTTTATSSATTDLLIVRRGIWQLRRWQRALWKHCVDTEQACAAQSAHVSKQEHAWASLEYEKAHLESAIARVQQLDMPFYHQVRKQQQQQKGEQEDDIGNDKRTTQLEKKIMMQELLDDPQQRSVILQQLQDEQSRRATLEAERTRLGTELQQIRQASVQNHTFLTTTLPKHLQTLEQATKPLQSWLAQSAYTGSARTDRLHTAQTLTCAPLFTLFVTLQEAIDHAQLQQQQPEAQQTNDSSSSTMTLKVVSNTYRQEVQWTLPVPDVSNQNNTAATAASSKTPRPVTIHFQKAKTAERMGARCITATVSGAAASLDQTWLLTRLFPNDDHDDDRMDNDHAKKPTKPALPFYRWVHYLAGIQLVPSSTKQDNKTKPHLQTTAVIIQTLQRRIRANATLKHILVSLQQRKLPSPPTGQYPQTTAWTIVSFKEITNTSTTATPPRGVAIFELVCRQGRTNELKARVRIDKAAYPGVPPVWDLTEIADDKTETHVGSNNTALSELERVMNYDLLRCPPTKTNETDQAKNEDPMEDEGTPQGSIVESESTLLYSEWILAHQLFKLLQDWESVANASRNSNSEGGARLVRGRDRAMVKTHD